jgi:DNA-binding LacI/PurR family transcriptional regulator
MSVIQNNTLSPDASPLYQRIRNILRERIAQGVWENEQMLPSRRSLCLEFNTTQITLDKAIQGLIREGLLRATRGSGTFVTHIAQTVAPIKALRIGVVIKRNDLNETLEEHWDDNFYFGPLFRGIRTGVVGTAAEVLYTHLQRSDYEPYFREKALDGLILVLPPLDDLPVLHEMANAGVPVVAAGFSTRNPADARLTCVDVDNSGGAAAAVRHLLKLGHNRIAIVNLALSQANHHDRLEGYRQALSEAGMTLDPNDLVLAPVYNALQFEDHIDAWLKRSKAAGTLPTAIFACDYLMTLATLRVLRRHGLRVPEDMSVVSFDDPVSAAHLTPPLTTVRQPVARLGQIAAQRLLQSLQGTAGANSLHGAEILPTELIIRESTAPPRTTDLFSHHAINGKVSSIRKDTSDEH